MSWVSSLTAVVVLLSGCTQAYRPPEPPPTPDLTPVVHATGLPGVTIGAHRGELARHLDQHRPGCNTPLLSHPQGSLVFTEDDRLVLVWFEAPLRTPGGVKTGTPLKEVKKIHPEAVDLVAPAGSHRFDGLLVASGEHGYLFLHDGQTVRKAIAGYTDYLHRLFHTGFGVC